MRILLSTAPVLICHVADEQFLDAAHKAISIASHPDYLNKVVLLNWQETYLMVTPDSTPDGLLRTLTDAARPLYTIVGRMLLTGRYQEA